MSDFLDNIFDFDGSGELTAFETPTGSGVEFFNPKPEGAKKYVATVRLLVNLKSPKDSIVFKKQHWLEDAQGKFSCDSSSTIGITCPVSKAYFALDGSKIPAQKELAKSLKINKQYVVYLQIVADAQTPDNVGKILPWKMPVEVYNKVHAWMNPSAEEIAGGKKPKQFFKPLESVNLILTVFNKTDNGTTTYRGYDVELTDPTTITIDGKALQATKEDQELFKSHLTEQQTYDLVEKFAYAEPDVATKARVKALLVSKYGQNGSTFWVDVDASAPASNGTPSIVGDASPSQPATPATVVDATATPAQTEATETVQTSQPAQGSEQDLDAILDGIGQ